MILDTHDQLLEVRGKMEPLSVGINNLNKQINQVKKETDDLCCRETELQAERIIKEKKLNEMDLKVGSKTQQVRKRWLPTTRCMYYL